MQFRIFLKMLARGIFWRTHLQKDYGFLWEKKSRLCSAGDARFFSKCIFSFYNFNATQAYGHRSGDRECPLSTAGNIALDAQRQVKNIDWSIAITFSWTQAREDPMARYIAAEQFGNSKSTHIFYCMRHRLFRKPLLLQTRTAPAAWTVTAGNSGRKGEKVRPPPSPVSPIHRCLWQEICKKELQKREKIQEIQEI